MNRKNLIAVALSSALTVGTAASWTNSVMAADSANAEESNTPEKAAENAADPELVRLSQDAGVTMQDVQGARLALFNGQTARARVYLDAAAARVAQAVEEASDYALNKDAKAGEDMMVPFDASLTLAEALSPKAGAEGAAQAGAKAGDGAGNAADANSNAETPAAPLAKANRHLQAGDTEQALEDLQVREYDVLLAASIVPVKFAQAQIDSAVELMDEGDFYAAGLALKHLEDAVVVNTVVLEAPPKAAKEAAS